MQKLRTTLYPLKRGAKKLRNNIASGVQLAQSEVVTLPYVGSTVKNLGDIALFDIIQELMVDIPLVKFDEKDIGQFRVARSLDRRLKYFCLGGGSLINSPQPLFRSRYLTELGMQGFSFGTGINDPEFWDAQPHYPREMDEWGTHLQTYKHITVRGNRIQDVLQQYGLANVEIIGDTALYLWRKPKTTKTLTKRIAINVGVNRSGIFWGNDPQGVISTVQRAAKTLLQEGYDLHIISVWDVDYQTVKEFAASLDTPSRVTIEQIDTDVQHYMDVVSNCDLLIAIKLHATVLGLCASTPVVSLEYRPKCYEFMKSVHLEDFNVRVDQVDVQGILALAHEAMERASEINDTFAKAAQHYKAKITEFGAQARRLVLQG